LTRGFRAQNLRHQQDGSGHQSEYRPGTLPRGPG
jgi:hypothetical protein